MSERTCSVDGCVSPYLAKGMCNKHYLRLRKTGTTDLIEKPQRWQHGTTTGYSRHNCRCDDCREAERQNKAAYRSRHPERTATAAAEYEQRNKDRISQRRKLERQADPDKFRNRFRDYSRRNPEVRRLSKLRRRATEARAEKLLVTVTDWRRLLHQYRHRCAYCGSDGPLTREHVIPLSRGGRHSVGNLLPVCGSCNYSKAGRLLVEWRRHVEATNPQRLARS